MYKIFCKYEFQQQYVIFFKFYYLKYVNIQVEMLISPSQFVQCPTNEKCFLHIIFRSSKWCLHNPRQRVVDRGHVTVYVTDIHWESSYVSQMRGARRKSTTGNGNIPRPRGLHEVLPARDHSRPLRIGRFQDTGDGHHVGGRRLPVRRPGWRKAAPMRRKSARIEEGVQLRSSSRKL